MVAPHTTVEAAPSLRLTRLTNNNSQRLTRLTDNSPRLTRLTDNSLRLTCLEITVPVGWALITIIIIIIIINLIYIAQFDTNCILTALYIVIMNIHETIISIHRDTYTVTCTNRYLPTY